MLEYLLRTPFLFRVLHFIHKLMFLLFQNEFIHRIQPQHKHLQSSALLRARRTLPMLYFSSTTPRSCNERDDCTKFFCITSTWGHCTLVIRSAAATKHSKEHLIQDYFCKLPNFLLTRCCEAESSHIYRPCESIEYVHLSRKMWKEMKWRCWHTIGGLRTYLLCASVFTITTARDVSFYGSSGRK